MAEISVIVPIYNTEQYLERCLRSVMKQSFQDIEILCVDDCSPDQSVAIVERLAREDSRIRLLRHKENLGLGGARNTGIRAAQAPYLASVDSDDRMHPDMLANLRRVAKNKAADVVVCGYARVNNNGDILRETTFKNKTITNSNNNIDIFSVANPAFWNKLWRKSLYADNSIFFPNHVFYQDLATTPRVMHFAKKICFMDDVLYYYNVRAESATHSYSAKHIMDHITVFDILYNFLIENDLFNIYHKKFVRRFDSAIAFHASNVAMSNTDERSRIHHLRLLLMAKFGYHNILEHHVTFMRLDQESLLSFMRSARSMRGIVQTTPEYKNDQIRRKLPYRFFRAFFSPFMSARLQKQLEKDPTTYFANAKHPVARFLRRMISD